MTRAPSGLHEAFAIATRNARHADAGTTDAARSLGVASLVLDACGGEDATIAALLLPVADADPRTRAAAAGFGPAVDAILRACADDARPPGNARARASDDAWRAARRHRLLRLDAADDAALLVAACDALYRVRQLIEALESPDIGPDALRDAPGGADGALRDAHALAQLCLHRGIAPARALDRAVDRLHMLARKPMREGLEE